MRNELDKFTQAYIECAIWSSTDDDGDPLDGEFTVDDLSPECLKQMTDDCADFQQSFAHLMEGLDPAQCGHDFWLTRNRHGAGFWDRGLGEIGRQLTDMAHPYGECNLYVAADNRIYC
jgi:hypothetical protein